MSLDHDNLGDYTPAPKKRGRISRARKGLIVAMAIGAFAATSGAGTFASFTASTDNPGGGIGDGNNPFQTPEFELTNTVLSRSGANVVGIEDECESSDELEEFPAGDPLNGITNASYCEVLFAPNSFATTATANLLLENTGGSSGNLVFYAATVDHLGTPGDAATPHTLACVIDASITATGHQSLCGDWTLTIQEHEVGGAELGGSGAPAFTNGTRTGECVYPSGTNVPTNADCSTAGTFTDLPLFTDDEEVLIGSLPEGTSLDKDAGDAGLNDDRRYFRITAVLTKPACAGDVDLDGFDDDTGVGCYNPHMNGSAVIQLRWVLTA